MSTRAYPYESGIDTYGDTHGRFGISFYIYALLFVAFDIEVDVHLPLGAGLPTTRTRIPARCSSACWCSSAILLFGLAYAWRKKVLTWR